MFKFLMSDDELFDVLSSKNYATLTQDEKDMLDLLSSDEDEEDADVVDFGAFRITLKEVI